MNQQEHEPVPERMNDRCPLCMILIPAKFNTDYIDTKVLHIVGEHKRTIEQAHDLISRYNP